MSAMVEGLLIVAPLLLVIVVFARMAYESDKADEERAKREGREPSSW